jgi:hypothetical protein
MNPHEQWNSPALALESKSTPTNFHVVDETGQVQAQSQKERLSNGPTAVDHIPSRDATHTSGRTPRNQIIPDHIRRSVQHELLPR